MAELTTTDAATPVPVKASLWRGLPLVLVWAIAIWPVAMWLIAGSDPELAVRLGQYAATAALQTGMVLGVLAVVAAFVFPPFPAWLRLVFERTKGSIASDRGPLLRALVELQHFESPARHLEAGRLALSRNELPLAGTHLSRAVELDPTVAGAQHQFGLLLFRVGQLPMAIAAFQRAEQLDPGHAFGDALLNLGRCALVLGDEPSAARLLEEHARRYGGSRRSHYWLGKARMATGNREGAIEAMRFAAAPTKQRLTAEENWFRALARVWLLRWGRS